MDLAILLTLALSFAVLATVHVALSFSLCRRPPWWRGLLALVLVPLAPYWGWLEKMRFRAIVWLGAMTIYAFTLIAAVSRG